MRRIADNASWRSAGVSSPDAINTAATAIDITTSSTTAIAPVVRHQVPTATVSTVTISDRSNVAADGHIFFTTESGAVVVVAPGGDFSPLAINQLGEDTYATPALADGRL